MLNDKLEEVLQLSKITDLIKEKKKDEKAVRTLKIILICIGALTVVCAAAYVLYRIFNRYDDDYDLYDDLDNYYDDDLEEAEEAEDEE